MHKLARRTALRAIAAAFALGLGGCGQKGSLYLPEERLDELKKKKQQLGAAQPATRKAARRPV